MKVLALASYPSEAAATRYRLEQFVAPLAKHDITLTIHPFLNSKLFDQLYRHKSLPRTVMGLAKAALLRPREALVAREADLVLIQREVMIFGPPLIEWLITRALRRPMVLDLDDATYVSYTSPTYGGFGTLLKWSGKTDNLIKWATTVVCGNRSIAEYVSSKGTRARIIPTVVDTDVFRPARGSAGGTPIALGWIGTHSTFPYLESIFPVLQELAKKHRFRLKIVGAGKDDVTIQGVEVENRAWKLERELEDFQSIDIGLYPVDASLYSGNWASGKSGFKAIQYMAVGIPYVATPIGASADIGEAGITHFFATTNDEWYQALDTLMTDTERRVRMGTAGRRHVTEHYRLSEQVDKLAIVLRQATDRSGAGSADAYK